MDAPQHTGTWQTWLDRPDKLWLRGVLFQVHFWLGAIVGMYVFVMSASGSLIVYRGTLFDMGISVERIVDLHSNLLIGARGRALNGFGAICLAVLCATGAAIWWPGTKHWRRSLRVEWAARSPRINWDLHSAVGFWSFAFVLMWGVSGIYLSFPDRFAALLFLNPAGQITLWLSELHFGRFNAMTKAAWALIGLLPALLAFTGIFVCCRRVMFKKPSNPNLT